MALLHGLGSPFQDKDMHICNKPTEIKVCSKVNVEVANEDNVMQRYVPDEVSVYSPCVKDSSTLGISNVVETSYKTRTVYRLEQSSNDGPNALPCSESAVARCTYSYTYGHANEVGFFNKLTVTVPTNGC